MILFRGRSILTDKTVCFHRNDLVLIDRQKKTALVTDIAVPLTQNLPKTEAQRITKYENLAMEIKNIWKLDVSIYHLFIGHQKLPTISTEYRFNQKHL
jgi:hypothetical protein